jgi:uncharacterized membrane protein
MVHDPLYFRDDTDTLPAEHYGPLAVSDIGVADLGTALRKGWADFWAKPSHLLFLGLFYPIAGLFLCRLVVGYDVLPMLFPLMAGFTLVGPFAAIGLYEISRRLERGENPSWDDAIQVFRPPNLFPIAILGLTLFILFLCWLGVAMGTYRSLYGPYHVVRSLTGFYGEVISTAQGWTLITVTFAAGFLFALIALAIGFISFPLIIDRHCGVVVAVATSVRAMLHNPVTVLLWGLIVAALIALGFVTLMIGLAIIMPVLGHATWHLYRRLVPVQVRQGG